MLSYKRPGGAGRLLFPVALGLALSLFAYSGPNAFAAEELSEYHTLNIDPVMRKKIGPVMIKEVLEFFKRAEVAIEKKRHKDLLDLYSSKYENGSHDKASAARIWKRIFSTFDNMASIHNMRLKTYSPEKKVMIIRCSGLLLGSPANEKELITIDSWTNEDHVLTKESGKWKLKGIFGKKKKRFWFDKPMHPLF